MKSFHKDEMICICQVSSAHGVKGEVKLFSFMEDRLNIKSYPILFDENGISYEVKVTGLFKGDLLIVRLNDMTDRNEAEALKGKKFYVERKKLPELTEEEYYHADLIGLDVITTSGDNVGSISSVHNFGAGDILEVKKGNNVFMLPFSKEVVLKLDFEKNRIISLPLEDVFIESDNDILKEQDDA